MGYTVKMVAERTNLSANTLRYYEKEGLLPSIKRTKSGIRHYSDEDFGMAGFNLLFKKHRDVH